MVKCKAVAASFNLDDPLQKKVYDHVKSQSNSSFYMKSLAMMDMLGQTQGPVPNKQAELEIDFNSFT